VYAEWSRERSSKRRRQLAPGTTGLVGPARVAEGGKDDNRRGGKMVSKNKHRVVIRDVNIVARAAALTISTCSLQAQ
jgi:hypothetical protein